VLSELEVSDVSVLVLLLLTELLLVSLVDVDVLLLDVTEVNVLLVLYSTDDELDDVNEDSDVVLVELLDELAVVVELLVKLVNELSETLLVDWLVLVLVELLDDDV
jgi:hypothetical protein